MLREAGECSVWKELAWTTSILQSSAICVLSNTFVQEDHARKYIVPH